MAHTTGVFRVNGEDYHVRAHMSLGHTGRGWDGYIIKDGEWFAMVGEGFESVQDVWAAAERRIHELLNHCENTETT